MRIAKILSAILRLIYFSNEPSRWGEHASCCRVNGLELLKVSSSFGDISTSLYFCNGVNGPHTTYIEQIGLLYRSTATKL